MTTLTVAPVVPPAFSPLIQSKVSTVKVTVAKRVTSYFPLRMYNLRQASHYQHPLKGVNFESNCRETRRHSILFLTYNLTQASHYQPLLSSTQSINLESNCTVYRNASPLHTFLYLQLDTSQSLSTSICHKQYTNTV